MPRPRVLRGLAPGSLDPRTPDRRIAAGGFAIAAIAVLVAVAASHAPLPSIYVRDPDAAHQLLVLERESEHGHWLVTFGFTRRLANGQVLHEAMQEARGGHLHVLISGSVMLFERRTQRFDCNLVDKQSQCLESARKRTLSQSAVLGFAIKNHTYDVVRDGSVDLAGHHGQCFRVRAAGAGMLPDLGYQTRTCFTDQGAPLLQQVERTTGVVDERDAEVVFGGLSNQLILRLARSFDPSGKLPGG